MIRKLLALALMLLVVAAASAIRLARLDNRPMHCDEAVHAVKFGRLLEDGAYVYDPREYHGPSLSFLTLPIAWMASATRLTEVTEFHLRLLPALFGIALVGMVWLLRDELGPAAAFCAAVLTAASPAMVFFSRYYIQEMLLVCFTFGAMVAMWRYARLVAAGVLYDGPPRPSAPTDDRRPRRAIVPFSQFPTVRNIKQAMWLVLLGLCVGMMHASKETCVIALFAMSVAAAVTMPPLRHIGCKGFALASLVVLVVAASVSALFFSSFLDNPRGVLDSYATYFHYLGRASGEGSEGLHVYPWYHYFRTLFWWRLNDDAPLWSEAPIAALALAGLLAAALRKGIEPTRLPLARFLAIYTIIMVVVYSALPYKTPWCALGLLHGMILLAGIGAAAAVRLMPHVALKVPAIVLIAVATGHLGWQAWQASFVAQEDPNNPYVYAHTTSDVLLVAQHVKRIAAVHPRGSAMHIQVICPDDDYWPLPWYLRGFSRVEWSPKIPRSQPAPLIITKPEMEPALLQYLYVTPPPGQRPAYVPVVPEEEGREWQLRPHVPLRVYVQLNLWERCDPQQQVEP